MTSDVVHAVDRKTWRKWLEEDHACRDEIWLAYYKKDTGKPTVTYKESVEEAICFGWIDGLRKRIDDECYCHRFSPRKPKSKWTPTNIEIAERMIAQKKMLANKRAWKFFSELTPDYRKQYVQWLTSAKSEDTRKRRLAEAISLLESGKKLGMK